MGLFGSSLKKTDTEFSWNKNKIVIEDGYLRSEGLINTSRIPMKHIDTVTYSFEGINKNWAGIKNHWTGHCIRYIKSGC